MRREFFALMDKGEYDFEVFTASLVATETKGLWRGVQLFDIDPKETIHGNRVKVAFEWLQIGMTKNVVAEDIVIYAHGKNTKVTAENFWEEMRKHI